MSTVFSFAFLFQQDYQNRKSESSNKQTEQIQEKKTTTFNQLQDKNRIRHGTRTNCQENEPYKHPYFHIECE